MNEALSKAFIGDNETETVTMEDALTKAREICLAGLDNFKDSVTRSLLVSSEDPGRFNVDFDAIEAAINGLSYIDTISRYYKFQIGPYEVLYDRFNN